VLKISEYKGGGLMIYDNFCAHGRLNGQHAKSTVLKKYNMAALIYITKSKILIDGYYNFLIIG